MNEDENQKIWGEAIAWWGTASPDARKLVQSRAMKKAPEGSILTTDDDGLPATFLGEYADVLAEEIRAAFIRRVTDRMIADGQLKVVRVLPTGERVIARGDVPVD